MSKPYQLPSGRLISTLSPLECDMLVDEIFAHEVYGDPCITYRDGDVIIDLGANIGLFIIYASERAKHLNIFACEPIPDTCQVLRDNAKQVSDTTITVLEEGVAAQPCVLEFEFAPRFPCGSTGFPDRSADHYERKIEFTLDAFSGLKNPVLRHAIAIMPGFSRRGLAKLVAAYFGKKKRVACNMTTISAIITKFQLQRVDLLKMDIEGAEVEALRGIQDDHWSRIQQVCIETHFGDALFSAVKEILISKGFQLNIRENPLSSTDNIIYGVRPAS